MYATKDFEEYPQRLSLKSVKLTMMYFHELLLKIKWTGKNSTISQRFFAKEVEEILISNGHYTEAEFV